MPSAFIQFSNSKRDEVKAANPKAGFGDIGKILGKMWQKLSEEEKAKYASTGSSKKSKSSKKVADEKEKENEKEEVEVEVKEEKGEADKQPVESADKQPVESESVDDSQKSNKTASKKSISKKSVTKKKRPLSAFIVFCNEKRDQVKKENPNASFGEIGKILGKMWREKKGEK